MGARGVLCYEFGGDDRIRALDVEYSVDVDEEESYSHDA